MYLMIFIKVILFLLVFIGLFKLLCFLYYKKIKDIFGVIFQENLSTLNIKFFNFFILLNILLALIGIITSFLFLNDFSINYVYFILCSLSVLGFILCKKKIFFEFKARDIINIFIINYKNIFFILIFLNFIFALNKSFLPWYDQDEITQYGYFTRLYAEGWTIKNNIWEDFSRFGELMFSSFYFVTNNLVFIKIFKSLLFVGNIFCFFCVIKAITASKKIAGIASLILTTIPELSYVGFFSMKTDYMLFCYEITSIILICLSIYHIYKQKIKETSLLSIILLSIFFSSIAFCIRLSGLYILLLNFLLLVFILFKIKIYKKNINYFFFIACKVFLIFIFTFIPIIIYNLIEFGNPFYPIGGVWTNILPNPKIHEFWVLEKLKPVYNINIGIPILNEIYILFYNSLGLGRTYFRDFDFIINPSDFASSGWFSPVTLIMLLAPLYFKKSKLLFIFSMMFLFLFLFWVNGIQYSRVFLASSSLAIIVLSICISINKSLFFLYLSKALYFLSITTCLLLTLYHFEISSRSNPYGVKMLFKGQYILEDNTVKSLPRLEWDKYILNDIRLILSGKKNNRFKSKDILYKSFDYNDIDQINKILNENKIDVVIHNLSFFPYLHTLLNKGYIVFESDLDPKENESILTTRSKVKFNNKNKLCYLYQKNYKEIKKAKLLYSNKKGLKLICKIKS